MAEAYAKRFYAELDRKPFDRKMLDWFIEKVDSIGEICDLGCGSGYKEELRTAGFELEEAVERDPYPDVEVQTCRAYLFAKKP
ncbi:hypothetical protein [Leptolyngbya sp. NIES-2104]|uniref:hypothetical protein n=1 Tax=Leptolyngbya sp. NIES-2104 TaxID=1552121 RepID=UPI00073E682B|nr:hypothetical protein [Leptolyngbya sp. NIES-2104]